jgi:hypothetical protein
VLCRPIFQFCAGGFGASGRAGRRDREREKVETNSSEKIKIVVVPVLCVCWTSEGCFLLQPRLSNFHFDSVNYLIRFIGHAQATQEGLATGCGLFAVALGVGLLEDLAVLRLVVDGEAARIFAGRGWTWTFVRSGTTELFASAGRQ